MTTKKLVPATGVIIGIVLLLCYYTNSYSKAGDQTVVKMSSHLEEGSSVQKGQATVQYNGQNLEVHYVRPMTSPSKTVSVLLLHGQSFSSANWVNIGTLSILGQSGYDVIAVDLPGYGKSPSAHISNRGLFLTQLIQSLKLNQPVIVSPSMSGSFSLPYIFDGDAASVLKRSKAFIPIAPVSTDKYVQNYQNFKIPTLIVTGERDETLGRISRANLKNIPDAESHIIPNAGHACYLNQPEEFHQILLKFLGKLS